MNAIETLKAAAARAALKSRPQQREAAQAKAEQTAQAKSRFKDDFELVAEFYKLRECGEYEHALDIAKRDVVGAKRCYHAIANSLRREETRGQVPTDETTARGAKTNGSSFASSTRTTVPPRRGICGVTRSQQRNG